MTAVVQVEGLGKQYALSQPLGGYTTLREVLASGVGRVFGRVQKPEMIWALRDVGFSLEQGDSLGVVGHNGAGKTTLLKILARITHPTTGASRTRGRVGSLLDVGTGFHPELTGRENIYFNGSLLGMKRREIDRRFDEIVEFAGLERFLDTPIKRFSWGMWLRLAFAVAAHVEPDVMLVDEVLAVGDVRFREKCLGKMTELGREGRTVVFVSHDLGAVVQACRRAIWIEHGQVQADGASEDVVERYLRSAVGNTATAGFTADAGRRAQLQYAAITGEHGDEIDAPRRDKPFTLYFRFVVREAVPGLDVVVSLQNHAGVQVLEEDWALDTGGVLAVNRFPQEFEVKVTVPPVLPAGDYFAGFWIGSTYETVSYEPQALGFRLWPRPEERARSLERNRLVQPGVTWDVRPVTAAEGTAPAGDGG
jgi:ABC-2 type transport system ATP-binding protein/lipopolysaccharide transport system ATP-binding protein